MTTILLFFVIIIGINCIPLLTRMKFPKLEKIVTRIANYTLIIFVIYTALFFSDYRLKGTYTNPIIGLTFIFTNLLFFGLIKNTKKKILRVLLVAPVILLSLFTLIFSQVIAQYKIDDTYKIDVSTGGFLSCGEIIKITKSEFGIFDKEVHHESSICLRGIDKIKISEFNRESAELLIFHNGEMDSENPYKYNVKLEYVW